MAMQQHRVSLSRLTILLLCIGVIASVTSGCGIQPRTFLPPPVPFDVSKNGSVVDMEVKLTTYRNYYFNLRFDYSDEQEMWHLSSLLKHRYKFGTNNPSNTEVVVPIYLQVTSVPKIEHENSYGDEIYETFDTYSHGFCLGGKPCGHYERIITVIALRPGKYRIQAKTVQDTPEFSGVPTSFVVSHHYNERILQDK